MNRVKSDKLDRLLGPAREKVAALAELMGLAPEDLQVRRSLHRVHTDRGDRTVLGVGVFGHDKSAVTAAVSALHAWLHREGLVSTRMLFVSVDRSARPGGPFFIPTLDAPEPEGAWRGMVEVYQRRE